MGCQERLGRSKQQIDAGYFFPQTAVATTTDSHVVTPAQVRWVHGAPALLVTKSGEGTHRFLDVGVFVGLVPQTGEAISIV